MPTADEALLRVYLGEPIPEGGSDADTMLSHAQVTDLLARNGGQVVAATVEGWGMKAAQYASQVDVTDPDGSRQLSQLHRQALTQLETWRSLSAAGGFGAAAEPTTRVHRIRRPAETEATTW